MKPRHVVIASLVALLTLIVFRAVADDASQAKAAPQPEVENAAIDIQAISWDATGDPQYSPHGSGACTVTVVLRDEPSTNFKHQGDARYAEYGVSYGKTLKIDLLPSFVRLHWNHQIMLLPIDRIIRIEPRSVASSEDAATEVMIEAAAG